jgi:hypothetical protein
MAARTDYRYLSVCLSSSVVRVLQKLFVPIREFKLRLKRRLFKTRAVSIRRKPSVLDHKSVETTRGDQTPADLTRLVPPKQSSLLGVVRYGTLRDWTVVLPSRSRSRTSLSFRL